MVRSNFDVEVKIESEPQIDFAACTFSGLTRLHYFGARYLDSRLSMWFGVDPLAEKMPIESPYNYVANNHLRYTDPTGMEKDDIVFYDRNGKEQVRIKSETEFKVYVQTGTNSGDPTYTEALMPGKITYHLDKGKDSKGKLADVDPIQDKYQKFDYEISAQTFIFNKDKSNNGSTEEPLDVNLVKALGFKESRLGQGRSESTSASDLLSMYNTRDVGDKVKIGFTLKSKSSSNSLYFGIRCLDFKKGENRTWWLAVHRYGPRKKEPDYKATVMNVYNSIKYEP